MPPSWQYEFFAYGHSSEHSIGGGVGGGDSGDSGDNGGDSGLQPDTSISNRRKKSKSAFARLPSKRIALVSTGTGRMNVVSWPFCDSPEEVCDQLVCANTVIHADVVRLCTCSSKPVCGLGTRWYTTIFSTSLTSGHESVTLLLGGTCRAVDGAHPVSPSVSAEQSRDPPPQ